MRQVVMIDDVRELEIWPSDLFDKYLEITQNEVKRLLVNKDKLIDVSCPACGNRKKKEAFKKFCFNYVECKECNTLYVSPRPPEKLISNYYSQSKALDFWYSNIVEKTQKDRMEHLSRPRAMWISNLTNEYLPSPNSFISISPMSHDFIYEIYLSNIFKSISVINPHRIISNTFSEKKGLKIIDQGLDEISDEVESDVACAFGVLDRVFDPEKFLKLLNKILNKDGLLFLTTSCISGFDLQVLWNYSKSIYPPDRINILSIESLALLLEKQGFEIIELSTPGQLDIELVKNAIEKNKDIKVPRFISYLINSRSESAHRSFQEFLQQFKLSSHVRIAAKKI